jgi:arylsulfatase A-like enzyme
MTDITRRRVLQGSGAVAASLALASCTNDAAEQTSQAPPSKTPGTSPITTRSPNAKRPNIIVILADDMGYADLGCWGSEIATPNIDTLAENGWRFTQMHNNPRCTVTRGALLTGLYPTQAGVGFNTGSYGTPAYQGYLNDSCVTLGEALGQAGYRTAIAGKWNVAPWGRATPSLPHNRGFERSLCDVGGEALTYYDTVRYLNGQIIGRSNDPAYYFTRSVTGYCVAGIKEFHASGDPFFLYAAYTAPHFPLQAPEADVALYHGAYAMGWDAMRQQRYDRGKAAGVIDPAWALPEPGPGTTPYTQAADAAWQQRRMEVYAAQITIMDEGVGRIVSLLEELGITDNTLILFLSDNGACSELVHTGNKHAQTTTRNGKPMVAGNIPTVMPGPSNTFQSYGVDWAHTSNTPFRMYKRWTEEGGISTPMVASWPGTLSTGGLDHRVMHVMDLMPTFLELAGASYPTTFAGKAVTPTEGQSLASVLAGGADQASWSRRGMLFWEHMGHRAARQGTWKIVSDVPEGGWELFNMATDRTETVDLANQYPTMLSTLSSAYDAWKARVGVRTWSDVTEYRVG